MDASARVRERGRAYFFLFFFPFLFPSIEKRKLFAEGTPGGINFMIATLSRIFPPPT